MSSENKENGGGTVCTPASNCGGLEAQNKKGGEGKDVAGGGDFIGRTQGTKRVNFASNLEGDRRRDFRAGG